LDAVKNFRDNGIGTDNLKYGAVYGPNLETVLDFAISEADIKIKNNNVLSTDKLSDLASKSNQSYAMAKAAIRDLPSKLPPSPSMVGIYAAGDNSRGVWKAPANVSVIDVDKPTIEFTNDDQDQMNVDTTAGKSVNAIRPFQGKGTLVWGARTLAGND